MEKEKTKRVGLVYCVKNKVTGEFYVGATTDSLQQRKLDHIERANRCEANKFHKAISTHGADAFVWEQIDTTSNTDELAHKEKQYILKYNSKEGGYNADSGGGFKKTVYQYDLQDGSLVNTYDCLENASNAINATKQDISRACLSVNKIYAGFFWSYEHKEPFNPGTDKRKKKVLFYNLIEEEELEFDSVAEASRQTGVSKSCIARFCRGERKPPEGYKWEYK